MDLSHFDYSLPEELIAQVPTKRRDESRLLVANRETGRLEDTIFQSLHAYLAPGDVLVLNDTFVFPARLFGKKKPGGAAIEMLLLHRLNQQEWEVIAYRASRLKVGTQVVFSERLRCEVIEVLPEGKFCVRFDWEGEWEEVLAEYGQIPLPPYINRKNGEYSELDRQRYQTIFAHPHQQYNSAAAPTAGLHFTDALLQRLKHKGIDVVYLTLQVGLDTFLPMRSERIEEHRMHRESFHLPEQTARRVETAWREGKRVVAVGTTAVRVLESAVIEPGRLQAGLGDTQLFIYPGYLFKMVNTLITNFHLPRTTLLLLVSAFMGNEFRHQAYEYAIEKRFRFYSYGDAMLIL